MLSICAIGSKIINGTISTQPCGGSGYAVCEPPSFVRSFWSVLDLDTSNDLHLILVSYLSYFGVKSSKPELIHVLGYCRGRVAQNNLVVHYNCFFTCRSAHCVNMKDYN